MLSARSCSERRSYAPEDGTDPQVRPTDGDDEPGARPPEKGDRHLLPFRPEDRGGKRARTGGDPHRVLEKRRPAGVSTVRPPRGGRGGSPPPLRQVPVPEGGERCHREDARALSAESSPQGRKRS